MMMTRRPSRRWRYGDSAERHDVRVDAPRNMTETRSGRRWAKSGWRRARSAQMQEDEGRRSDNDDHFLDEFLLQASRRRDQ